MRSRCLPFVPASCRIAAVLLGAALLAAPAVALAQKPPRPARPSTRPPRTPEVERPAPTPRPQLFEPWGADALGTWREQMHDLELAWDDQRHAFELSREAFEHDRLMDLTDRMELFAPHALHLPDMFDTPLPAMPDMPEMPLMPDMPHAVEPFIVPETPLPPGFPHDVDWKMDAMRARDGLTPRVWGDDVAPRAIREHPKDAWLRDDPADSLYRRARELLNRGDWKRAASVFREIPQKFPNSAYAADALYWQAFALYRMGGSTELRDALAALDVQRGKYPNAETQADASALGTRIRGALAARGDAAAGAAVARTASEGQASCDQEEQAVRIEALSALNGTDPASVRPLIDKILQRKDECSVGLRRSALFLVAGKRDASAAATLVSVAKNDPSSQVRGAAVAWMARMPDESIVGALEEIARSDDERLRRVAVRALVEHPSARARTAVRAIVERTDAPEDVRAEALGSFDREHSSSEDAAWLRSIYPKLETTRLKVRALSALTRIGGPDVDQLLASIVRNDDEPAEIRSAALRRLGQTMTIPDLAKFYDSASERRIREEILSSLSERKEPEATDKLIDIVKNGTDPQLRREAIAALTRKKDPRTIKLLMEIVDK